MAYDQRMAHRQRKASLSRNTHVSVIEFIHHVMLLLHFTSAMLRLSRYSRHDFHRFWFSDDLPEAVRLQRYWIESICSRAMHSMGHSNAWIF